MQRRISKCLNWWPAIRFIFFERDHAFSQRCVKNLVDKAFEFLESRVLYRNIIGVEPHLLFDASKLSIVLFLQYYFLLIQSSFRYLFAYNFIIALNNVDVDVELLPKLLRLLIKFIHNWFEKLGVLINLRSCWQATEVLSNFVRFFFHFVGCSNESFEFLIIFVLFF